MDFLHLKKLQVVELKHWLIIGLVVGVETIDHLPVTDFGQLF